jgi:hypothetical protein
MSINATVKGRVIKNLVVIAFLTAGLLAGYAFPARSHSPRAWEPYREYALRSAVFQSASYDPVEPALTLVFRNGNAYRYAGVSRKTWLTFMRVTHKGSFYNAAIRGTYKSRRLDTKPGPNTTASSRRTKGEEQAR